MADLTGVSPILVSKITKVLNAMAALGFPMKVTQGLRTVATQQALYAQGRTTPGPNVRPGKPLGSIVTNADGVIKRSRHQASAEDGLGRAVDCACAGPEPFGEYHPWKAYGACVEAAGLTWGGNANFIKAGINDRPHAELR